MAEKQKNEWEEREIGALWQKEGSKGTYFTGDINGQKVVIFANKHKEEGDNKPSYRIYKDTKDTKETKEKVSVKRGDDDLPI